VGSYFGPISFFFSVFSFFSSERFPPQENSVNDRALFFFDRAVSTASARLHGFEGKLVEVDFFSCVIFLFPASGLSDDFSFCWFLFCMRDFLVCKRPGSLFVLFSEPTIFQVFPLPFTCSVLSFRESLGSPYFRGTMLPVLAPKSFCSPHQPFAPSPPPSHPHSKLSLQFEIAFYFFFFSCGNGVLFWLFCG